MENKLEAVPSTVITSAANGEIAEEEIVPRGCRASVTCVTQLSAAGSIPTSQQPHSIYTKGRAIGTIP